ncbi:MAG TPA: hypothetical protein VH518_17735 [Tepidisphaeraceae bacterium]
MHRRIPLVSAILLVCTALAAAQTTRPADQPFKGELIDGLGDHHHPVSTSNAEAQKFFDQGLTLLFAFNHDEAMRSFMRAAELDPKLAMAHWGIAMATGPNYNLDVDPPREKAAHEEIQKAIELSKDAPQAEQDYIKALATRYSNDPNADLKKLGVDYSKAMGQLSERYPDDLDAAVFHAESLMILNPWRLWKRDGTPNVDTLQIVQILESVLKRNPDHMGANHLYIHTVEASPHPEWGLEAAGRLPALAPAAGHLVHMPAHIYSRTGDHDASAGSNASAATADEAYLKSRNDGGIYPMMYYSHNLHFLAFSNSMEGRFADSKSAAERLVANVEPHLRHMPMLEGFAITPTIVLVRFGKWDDIMKLADPGKDLPVCQHVWHFARGVALARTGKPDDAERERAAMNEIAKSLPPDAMFGMLNTASSIVDLSDTYLSAQIALARKDPKSAIALLTKAGKQEENLIYDEPPVWWLPVRESLGATLLKYNKPADAENVFRAELEWSPRSGRALAGLMQSLKAQNKSYDAAAVEQQLKASWKNADTTLRWEEL